MLDTVASTIHSLWQAGNDVRLGVCQRVVCQLMIVLAPRWLWREPQRLPDSPLPPHSRPKLLRQQLAAFH